MHKPLFAIILGVLIAGGPAGEAAGQVPRGNQGNPGPKGHEITGQLGASFNNPGLQNTLDVARVKPLSTSANPLLAGARVAGGVVSVTTPTMTRAGGWLEYAPLSIVAVRAGVEPVFYFGSFSSLMAFPSYDSTFDQDVLSQKTGTSAGVGLKSYITPSIQFRAGPLVARVSADFEHWRSSADGPYFYEATRDQLLASGGDQLINTTSVAMYEHRTGGGGTVSAGVSHGLTRVFDAGQNQSQRLGVIAITQFASTHLRVPKPRFTVLVYRYLDDRSKQDSWGGAIAIGFRTGR
ncbi:MAG: hypothetical protein R6V57_00115 [Vicinamibacterales bacterium]